MPEAGGLSVVDILLIAAYLAAILWVGRRAISRRKSGLEDYILAGRTLTLPTFVASLVTSFYGGVLGIGEFTYRCGVSNWLVQGAPYYVFAVLYAIFLAGRVRMDSGLSIPDRLERVYGKPTAVLGAMLLFVLACPADDVLMLGVLAHWLTGWAMWICLVAVTVLSISFLFRGGLRAQAWTGRLEILFMFGGFAVILPFAYLSAGGLGYLKGHLPPAHLDPTGGNSISYMMIWFFIALWTFVDPSFHQRVCSAKDARTARLGIAVSVLFWFLFDAMTTTAGLYARAMIPDLKQPLTAFPALAERLLPPVFRGLFFAGVASSTIAALGSQSFLSATSLMRDGLGRALAGRWGDGESGIRYGLVATSSLAVALALYVPSVVGLWYAIGSTVIPGLLVVFVSSYFPHLQMPRSAALVSGVAGWATATIAWLAGHDAPFYPGLASALGVWGVGLAWRYGRARKTP